MSFKLTACDSLNFDIKRSIILAEYIKCWGLPESRKVLTSSGMLVELYVFPGEDMDQVSRVATIGLSECQFQDEQQDVVKLCHSELLMVLPYDLIDDEIGAISDYLLAISKYIVKKLARNLHPEEIVASHEIATTVEGSIPVDWPSAVLLDEPRGEPSELNYFHIGMQHVKLSWVIPIFDSEYELIKHNSIDAFDEAVYAAGISLVEVRREPCV